LDSHSCEGKSKSERKGEVMKKMFMFVSVIALLVGGRAIAEAQQPHKIASIGYLSEGSASAQSRRINVFRQSLRELGYVEGQNVVIEYRWAEGMLDRLPYLAADLVRLRVDVIVAPRGQAADAARRATKTIPIIMAITGELVSSELVSQLKMPARNFTGFTILAADLCRKQLELLRETFSKVSPRRGPLGLGQDRIKGGRKYDPPLFAGGRETSRGTRAPEFADAI
jgi:putative ABC transport system substrate-binding protein